MAIAYLITIFVSKAVHMNKRLLLPLVLLFAVNWIMGQNYRDFDLCAKWKLFYGLNDKNAPATPDDLKSRNRPVISAVVPGNVDLNLLNPCKIQNAEVGNNILSLKKTDNQCGLLNIILEKINSLTTI